MHSQHSNALQLALKEVGGGTERSLARWVLGPEVSWKPVGKMSYAKRIDLRVEVHSDPASLAPVLHDFEFLTLVEWTN